MWNHHSHIEEVPQIEMKLLVARSNRGRIRDQLIQWGRVESVRDLADAGGHQAVEDVLQLLLEALEALALRFVLQTDRKSLAVLPCTICLPQRVRHKEVRAKCFEQHRHRRRQLHLGRRYRQWLPSEGFRLRSVAVLDLSA